MKLPLTPTTAVKFAAAVLQDHPEFATKYADLVQKPEPVLTHYLHLTPLMEAYCTLRGIATNDLLNRSNSNERKMFVAVCACLYDPALFSGYSEKAKDNLCHELAGLLMSGENAESDRVAISDLLSVVKVEMLKAFSTGAKEFKREVDECVSALSKQFVTQTVTTGLKQIEMFIPNNENY